MLSNRIIKMVGRTQQKSFVLDFPNDALSTPVKEKFNRDTAEIDVQVSTQLKPLPPTSKNCPRASSLGGRTYVEMMTTSSGSVYINESPQKPKEEREIQFAPERQRFFQPVKQLSPEYFEFTVTLDMVNERLQSKRPCSQRSVVGMSAKEIFAEYGAIIVNETNKNLDQFHLAHRQGWALGGAQDIKNLDPSTAGSNYTTLFTIESPLINLLIEQPFTKIHVAGKVLFHPEVPLPQEIIYTLSWGNGRSAQVSIYPLEYRSPTHSENKVATAVLSALRTPQKRPLRRSPSHIEDEMVTRRSPLVSDETNNEVIARILSF